MKKQGDTISLALCSWKRWEKHRIPAPKRINKHVASAVKKTHLHTVSGEDKHPIVFPLHKEQ